jgi:mono/diheme cytochrome c family protein
MVSAHALVLLESYVSRPHIKDMAGCVSDLMNRNDTTINLYLASSLGPWIAVSPDTFLPMLAKLSAMYSNNAVYQEAVVSSLKGREKDFQLLVNKLPADTAGNQKIDSMLAQTLRNKQEGKINSIFVDVSVAVDKVTSGLIIFRSTCAACHGADGEGLGNKAPPLKGSQYVEGSPDKLAMIILNGLTGPVNVNDKLYTFNGSMPNFGNNFTDQQIADVIGYLRNSFVTSPKKSIRAAEVKELRGKHSGTLTEKELLEMTGTNKN